MPSPPSSSRAVMRVGLRLAAAVAAGTGLSVMARGTRAIPGGAGDPSPTVDNVLRFYAAWWVGAGALLWKIAPDTREHDGLLKGALAVNFAGGLVRLLSARQTGQPHRLFQVIAIEELILSPAALLLQRRITAESPAPRAVGRSRP
jgi:hypothetical protein